MTVKEQVMEWIRALPDDCTLNDIQYQLELRARVEEGMRALDEGRVVPQEEAERRMAQWRSSNGPTQP
jgi:predicted transcriptional regulator